MNDKNGNKLTGILQIVRLKEILQKWQSVTLGPKPSNSRSENSPRPRSGNSPRARSETSSRDRSENSPRAPQSARAPIPPSVSKRIASMPRSDSDPTLGAITPALSKRLASNMSYCDSDEESCYSPGPPPDVPKGYLAVYVGPELRRFIIPTSYLSHNVFKVLLEKAEEEFGFDHCGGLTIPTEIETFKYLLSCIESHHKDHPHQNSDEDSIAIEEFIKRRSRSLKK